MKKIPNGFHINLSYEERKKLEAERNTLYTLTKYIHDKLIGVDIHVISEHRKIVMRMKPENIPHLLGIYHIEGTRQLWKDLKNQRLDIRKLAIKNDGTTFLKISSMQNFKQLFEGNSRLVGSMIYQKARFDSALRTNKLLLAIGLLSLNNGKYVPNTALDIHRKPIPTGEEVIAIFTTKPNSGLERVLKLHPDYYIDGESGEIYTNEACFQSGTIQEK